MSFRKFSRFAAGALIVVSGLSLTAVTTDADAARAGSGGNAGRQSSNVTSQRPAATPGVTQKSATPAAAPAAAAAAPAAAAAAKSGASRWLGPLAGIAAGLGIGALLSHFGLGGAMGDILTMVLLGVAVFFAISFLLRMFRGSSAPAALQGAGAGATPPPQAVMRESEQPQAASNRQVPSAFGSGGGVQEQDSTWFIPSDFDANSFLHEAKQQFVAIQKVWDSGDIQQLRNFLTDDLLAELQAQLSGRQGENQTEVVLLNAELLGIEKVTDGHLASVRFSGMLREQPGTEAFRFEEVWNLFKPAQGGWLLAGIQQIPVTHAS